MARSGKEDAGAAGAEDATADRGSLSGDGASLPGRVREEILHCLESLEEPARGLMRLKFREGLTYLQLSERSGLSLQEVSSFVHQSLKQVATVLEAKGVRL